jgi:hypothetical protein
MDDQPLHTWQVELADGTPEKIDAEELHIYERTAALAAFRGKERIAGWAPGAWLSFLCLESGNVS